MPESPAGAAELTWLEPIEVARGPARQGPWRMNDSEFHYVDDPTVGIDDGGRIVVAWAVHEQRDIFLQAYDQAGAAMLGAPVNVSKSPDIFSWLPRLAIAPADPTRVYLLW